MTEAGSLVRPFNGQPEFPIHTRMTGCGRTRLRWHRLQSERAEHVVMKLFAKMTEKGMQPDR
jgi:hypothetical protein